MQCGIDAHAHAIVRTLNHISSFTRLIRVYGSHLFKLSGGSDLSGTCISSNDCYIYDCT